MGAQAAAPGHPLDVEQVAGDAAANWGGAGAGGKQAAGPDASGASFTTSDADDNAALAKLGFKPQLKREFHWITSLAVSFTIVSVLTGLTGLYGLGYQYGGPAMITWSWPVCVALTTTVAMALAELASAMPTAGGVYFWAWAVAPRRARALAAWLTLWFNFIGLVGVQAGINYTFVVTLQAAVQLGGGPRFTPSVQYAVYVGVTAVHALINMLPVRYIGAMNRLSIVWHVVVTAAFCVALPSIAPVRQSAGFVFTKFQTAADSAGIGGAYSLLLSALMSQFTLTGYEASAKVSEETKAASTSAPRAIVLTVLSSGVVGWAYLLATTFSITSPDTLLSPDNATGGTNVFAQVLYDASMARFGDARAAVALLAIILPAQFFCGASCMTDGGRAIFAFARDGAMPFPRLLAWVHPRTRVPIVAVGVMALGTLVIASPMLGSLQAFTAVTSIATIGTYLSYGAPIALHLYTSIFGGGTFEPGPYSLGRWRIPVCAVATLWVLFITALFVLPTVLPVTAATLNYAGPLAGAVLLFALVWWFAGARGWFDGPLTTGGRSAHGSGDKSVGHTHATTATMCD